MNVFQSPTSIPTYFETFNPPSQYSHVYDLGLSKESSNFSFVYVNGIHTNFEGAWNNAEVISRYSGGYNVMGVYNATHGMEKDLTKCRMGLEYNAAYEPTMMLKNVCSNLLQQDKAHQIMIICNSGGAICTRNFLLDAPSYMQRQISVLAIAPAAFIPESMCRRVRHFVSKNDFIPWMSDDVVKKARQEGTLLHLRRHPKAPFFPDHAFNSPTYEKPMRDEIKQFIENNRNKR